MEDIIRTFTTIIITLASLISSIIAIEKFTKGAVTKWLLSSVLNKLDDLDKRIDKLELNDLKQIIMNDNIPISERIIAGDRYIVLGGNGDVKAHYKVLSKKYYKELESEMK